MVDEKQIIEKLQEMISLERLQHTLRVKDTALTLAHIYNVNEEIVNIAALLHDCAKGLDLEESVKLCEQLKVDIDDLTKRNFALIHAHLGAALAQNYFKINDQDILNAIRYHTTGRENMTMLEKIIWIADYTEPGRDFEGVDEVRSLSSEDINAAILVALKQNIKHIISKNYMLHPATINTYNSILKNVFGDSR